MWHQQTFTVETPGRGCFDITPRVAEAFDDAGIATGLCHVFVHHTSASLMLCENADPDVLRDLETWMGRAVPDGDPAFVHTAEGVDDMPAHVRSILTGASLTIPVVNARPGLGTWQGIYLYEHRHRAHRREVTVTLNGER